MHSPSFQDIELKFRRYVNDSTYEVQKKLTILPYLKKVGNKGLSTQKMLIQSAFTQFSRYIELKLHRYVNDSTVQVAKRFTILPYTPEGSGMKG